MENFATTLAINQTITEYSNKNSFPLRFLNADFETRFKPGNKWMIEELQKEVDEKWKRLLELEELTNK